MKSTILTLLIFIIFYLIASKINMTLAIIYLVVIIGLLKFFSTPKGKGILGERAVRRRLGKTNFKKNRYVLHDITFFDGEKSVQVDHILINNAGIHVIETKNFGGRIYGSENDYEWTQVLAYGRHKSSFYSPIRQNAGHIKSLKRLLGEVDIPFYSYIVFTDRAKIMNKNFKTEVIYVKDLRKRINKKKPVLNDELVKNTYLFYKDIQQRNTITNREHIKSVKKRLKN